MALGTSPELKIYGLKTRVKLEKSGEYPLYEDNPANIYILKVEHQA